MESIAALSADVEERDPAFGAGISPYANLKAGVKPRLVLAMARSSSISEKSTSEDLAEIILPFQYYEGLHRARLACVELILTPRSVRTLRTTLSPRIQV
jgi:hypothetical protein